MGEKNQRQESQGEFNAQAQDHSTAIVQVNHLYEHVPPLPVDEDKVAAAKQKLESLPLEAIPDVVDELPHGSRSPSFGANAIFVGREEELRTLAGTLTAGTGPTRSTIAGIAGLGGVGKTQLAGEFVYRYGQYFEGGVYWLRFADADNVRAEIAACGSSGSPELGSDFPRLPFDEKVSRVTAAWKNAMPRLLVFDNCEDVKLLAFWAPPVGGCRMLVTSRGKLEDASLGLNFVELEVLSRGQSVELLRKHLGSITAEESVLDGIAETLGDLPLALDLAGRFLVRFRATDRPHEYLAELRKADPATIAYHDSMDDPEGASPTSHEKSVARTFELDLRRLDASEKTDGLALKILSRAARLAPGTLIPRPLLLATLGLKDGDRQAVRPAERAILKLTQLGLIQGEYAFRMHQLVSGVVAKAIDDRQAKPDVENAVADAVGRFAEAGNYQAVLPLLPHLRFLANGIGQREDVLAGHLCFVLGALLSKMLRPEDYKEALSYTERALSIMETAAGPMHFRTLRILVNLGAHRRTLKDLDGALDAYRRALKVSRKVCGCRDPETAYAHNNLGSALRDKAIESGQLRYMRKAFRHYKVALKIREKKRPRHPDLAESLTNVGHLMLDLRREEEARRYLERSLQVDAEPAVPLDLRAKTLHLLGTLLRRQGHHSDAHSLLLQSFEAYERAFGPNHDLTKRAKELVEQLPRSAS